MKTLPTKTDKPIAAEASTAEAGKKRKEAAAVVETMLAIHAPRVAPVEPAAIPAGSPTARYKRNLSFTDVKAS